MFPHLITQIFFIFVSTQVLEIKIFDFPEITEKELSICFTLHHSFAECQSLEHTKYEKCFHFSMATGFSSHPSDLLLTSYLMPLHFTDRQDKGIP